MNLTKIMIKTTLMGMVFFGFSGCTKTVEPADIMSVNETAIDGYDTVAYFVSSKAVKADQPHVYNYKSLAWNFESQTNLEMFSSNPDAYTPAFGGFCAYELAEGDFVLSDPQYWYIHNGKLYLFKDEDAKTEWFRNIDTMLLKAEETWNLFNKPVEEEQFEEIGDSFLHASTPKEGK